MPPREPSTSPPPHAQSADGPAATPASAGSAADGADVTGLLIAWSEGDRAALDALLPVVYAELRRQARRALRRETAGHTLQPTALVHEAYLRLVDQRPIRWQSRAHFFGVAARCMRQVLVDAARTRRAAKRGRGAHPVTLDDADGVAAAPSAGGEDAGVEVLALDAALDAARRAGPGPGPARRAALLRRADARRHGRHARRFGRDRLAGVDRGPPMAPARVGPVRRGGAAFE